MEKPKNPYVSDYTRKIAVSKDFFKNKKAIFWLLASGIILLGIFLRSWHFSDWMRFELDQGRDSSVIWKALEGEPGELPLLGPKARGTFLRLGPIFYYFQYLSAKIFGGTPPAMAGSVLFFSVLSLPLFLFFCLKYFSRKISLLLLFLFSFSLFLIMYSRFAWNPNPLVFFVLLFSFSLLKATEPGETGGKRKSGSGWWLVLAAISLSVATQLHFVAFIVLPVVGIIFLIWKRPKINFSYWVSAFLAIMFFYTPVFINEIKTGGDNSKEFLKAVFQDEKEKKNEGGILRKIYFNFVSHSDSYALILTAKDNAEYLAINPKAPFQKEYERNSYLEKYSLGILGAMFFLLGAGLLFWRTKKEKDSSKKDFLAFCSIFLGVSFLFFIPIALELSPRFFLLVPMLPFVFLGLVFEGLEKLNCKCGGGIIILAVFFLALFGNFSETKKRFSELQRAPKENIFVEKDRILKESNRVTYFQQNLIADYILEKQKENNFPVYFSADARFLPAFEYILTKQRKALVIRLPGEKIYEEGNYFFITFSDPPNRYDIGKYAKKYDIVEERDFGTLTVLGLFPKSEFISQKRQDFSEKKKESRSRAPKRYKWNEIFKESSLSEDDLDEEDE